MCLKPLKKINVAETTIELSLLYMLRMGGTVHNPLTSTNTSIKVIKLYQ